MAAPGRQGGVKRTRRVAIFFGILAALVLTVVVLGETTGRRSGWGYVWGGPSFESGAERRVLLTEDFSTPSPRWPMAETDDASWGWDGGVYRIAAKSPGMLQFQTVPLDPGTDAIEIGVTVVQRTGNANDGLGVLCGGTDADGTGRGYLVGISPRGGAVSVLPYTSSEQGMELGEAPVFGTETTALHGLRRENELRIDCLGAEFDGGPAVVVRVNGEEIGTAEPDRGPVRFDHVGVFAANETGGGSDAAFDDVTVSEIAAAAE